MHISYYFSGSCQGTKQTGNASGPLSCLDEDHEGGAADDEGTGDFLSQCCQGTLQFHQKRARRRAQKSGEFPYNHADTQKLAWKCDRTCGKVKPISIFDQANVARLLAPRIATV